MFPRGNTSSYRNRLHKAVMTSKTKKNKGERSPTRPDFEEAFRPPPDFPGRVARPFAFLCEERGG
jgi:hypothetical protein